MDEQIQNYKSAIEALLFVSEKPVLLEQLKEVFRELKPSQIQDLIKQLQEEYVSREAGMVIVEIAGGFQMLSNSHAAVYIREFYKTKTKEKLSRPALESLAIIAYKQPVGRAEVEIIRGVNSDGTIAHLLNKGLIRITGRKEVPGRPFLYGTTKEFLEYFGLKSLEDLPKIEEFNQLGVDVPKGELLESQESVPVPSVEEKQTEAPVEQMQELTASQEGSGQSRLLSQEPLGEVAADEVIS
ncbi:MAG: SMC-Scp complex subunit ScpB [Candidatus Omnitrophica bacterium]|nr:SMC-Scp complex subunit ScpB [Candidatus Omnitrophota bacterium]